MAGPGRTQKQESPPAAEAAGTDQTVAAEAAASEETGAPEAPVSRSGDEPEVPAATSESEPEAADASGGGAQGANGEPARAAARVEQDLDELVETARQRDEYLSLAQRTQADFENYRKRASKDLAAAESRGISKLARELLPALDNLGLALASADGAGEEFMKGLRLVHSELTAALARVGVEEYSPEGEPFDPQVHEAMAQQPVEGTEPGTIVEVYQRGYRIDGTVLRPARVVVAA